MAEMKKSGTQGRKGFRSLTAMLISIIFLMIAVSAAGLASLGVYYLRQSMNESAQLYEELYQDGGEEPYAGAGDWGHI